MDLEFFWPKHNHGKALFLINSVISLKNMLLSFFMHQSLHSKIDQTNSNSINLIGVNDFCKYNFENISSFYPTDFQNIVLIKRE